MYTYADEEDVDESLFTAADECMKIPFRKLHLCAVAAE